MRRAILIFMVSCGGPPFTLLDTPDARTEYVISQEAATGQQSATIPTNDVRDLPDAGSGNRDSGGDGEMGGDGRVVDSAVEAASPVANRDSQIADASLQESAQNESGSVESGVEACAPPPVAGGYSNICATSPSRGSSIIQTFPGECACDWTCACLMTSSVCQGLGTPSSCQVVNGATCNSVVVAVVICK